MPSNFRLPSYVSDDYPEFPWFSDDDVVPTGSDSSRSGDKADGGEGSGDKDTGNAMIARDAPDGDVEETDPPVV